jgi:hypothetical protein
LFHILVSPLKTRARLKAGIVMLRRQLIGLKGGLLSILLTGGAAHDCPAAESLIRRNKAAKRLLCDKAAGQCAGLASLYEKSGCDV